MDYDERQIEFYKESQAMKKGSRFQYDKKKHLYWLDKKLIPSVTDIISVVQEDKFKYVKKDVLDKAKEKGNLIHLIFERVATKDTAKLDKWLFNNPEYETVAENFKEFIEDYELKNVYAETSGWANVKGLNYGFTIDNISSSKLLRKSLIIDYKTGQKNEAYENLQTGAYLGSLYLYNQPLVTYIDRNTLATINNYWARIIYYSKTNKFRLIDNIVPDWYAWKLAVSSFQKRQKEATS